MLLFNKDVYAFLGDYRDYDANNMGTRIQKAWCSALGLPYPDNATLVNFPVNPPSSTTAANMVSMAVQAGKKMEGTLDVTSIRTI